MAEQLGLCFIWRVYRLEKKGGLLVRRLVLERKNIQTNYGLTAYAGAFQPTQSSYVAPQWMGISTKYAQLQAAYGSTGVTSISTDIDPTQAGDSGATAQLILGVGTANQETVSWTAKAGTGPYTWTISATTKTHALHDPVTRAPQLTDTLAQFPSELQYDSTNFPNQRMQSVGGYSAGTANWTTQFYFTGSQALNGGTSQLFAMVGLFDSGTVAAGNMHNELALGFNHTQGNDVEVDVSLTTSNV
jgi:hypothetical protein